MTWIILTILLAVGFWAGVAMWMYGKRTTDAEGIRASSWPWEMTGLITLAASVVLWVGMSLLLVFHTVGEREVGIVYNFTGTIAGKREKGWVAIAPWQHMEKENVAIQHVDFVFGPENSAVSKDQQDILANLAVNFQIDAENVLDLYSRVGPAWESIIIDARVPQVFKEVTSTYQTPDITEKRESLREETRTRLTEELAPYDIKVIDVFITNLGFSAGYTASIEAKQEQVQRALEAEAKIKQFEAEAKQQVALAQGEARSNIARARGDAKANRLRQRSLTPLLVQQLAIEKLNPQVQMIICPPASVCIPNSGVLPVPSAP